MIKNAILFVLTLLSSFCSIAQISFPTGAAIWTERRGQGEAPHVWQVMEQRNEVLSAIGNSYKKLYSAQFPSIPILIGGMREDSAHRIYYYDVTLGAERKVYDFSMVLGDTLKTWGSTEMPIGIVHSIDTVTIGSIARKRINFRQLTATSRWTLGAWVEGIGNTGLGGLLANPMTQPTCDCGINTLCFSAGDTDIYHNPAYATYLCLPVLAGVEHTITAYTDVQLYPNPVQSSASFVTLQGVDRARVSIYDVQGKLMHNSMMNNREPLRIFPSLVASGVYIYSIVSENGNRYYGKLIIE